MSGSGLIQWRALLEVKKQPFEPMPTFPTSHHAHRIFARLGLLHRAPLSKSPMPQAHVRTEF